MQAQVGDRVRFKAYGSTGTVVRITDGGSAEIELDDSGVNTIEMTDSFDITARPTKSHSGGEFDEAALDLLVADTVEFERLTGIKEVPVDVDEQMPVDATLEQLSDRDLKFVTDIIVVLEDLLDNRFYHPENRIRSPFEIAVTDMMRACEVALEARFDHE